ncbi:MAG TPA: hypothetical protein VL201_00830, partial [Patescibacteria group bacterium]|nr:hypothetical protein [Patescibacteria group bacterium]
INQYGSKQSIFYFYELKSLIEKTNTFIPISINPKALDIVDFISIRLQKKTNFSEAFEDAVVTFYINRKSEQKIELTDCDVKLLTSYQIRAAAPPIHVIVRTYFLDRIKHVYTTLWNLPKNENKNALFVAFAPLAVVALIFFPTLRKNFVNNLTPEEQFKIIGGFFAFLFYLYKAPKTKTVTL